MNHQGCTQSFHPLGQILPLVPLKTFIAQVPYDSRTRLYLHQRHCWLSLPRESLLLTHTLRRIGALPMHQIPPLSHLPTLYGLHLANCAAHELRPSGLQLSTLHPILHHLTNPARIPFLPPPQKPLPLPHRPNPNPRIKPPPNPNLCIKPPPLRLCHPLARSTSSTSSP